MSDNPNFHANLTASELQAKIAELTIEIPSNRQLTRDDLPSKAQLEALWELRGEEALICYAWRNALRVLLFMVLRPLGAVWIKDTSRHCFATVRALALLQTIWRGNRAKVDFRAAATKADDATRAATTRAAETRAAANVSAAYAAANAAKVANAANAYYAAYYAAAYFADDAAVSPALEDAIMLQSIADFNALVAGYSPGELFVGGVWLERDSGDAGLAKREKDIESWHKLLIKLHSELKEIGLAFLANDLQHLYQGQWISDERMALYIESLNYEEVILNNAEELTAIFEGRVKTEANPRIRVMLVGPGGAGKTSLFQLLTQREAKQQNNATVAINTAEVDLAVHTEALPELEDVKLDMTLWDFSGQSVFYNLHRGFMRNNNAGGG